MELQCPSKKTLNGVTFSLQFLILATRWRNKPAQRDASPAFIMTPVRGSKTSPQHERWCSRCYCVSFFLLKIFLFPPDCVLFARLVQMFVPPGEDLVNQWESEQARLRLQVMEEDTEDWQRSPDFSGLERVGGVDLSFIKGDDVNACAQLVVLSYPDMEVLYEDSQMVTLTAPYIAGFLAFRETPFLLEALQRLERNQPKLLPQVVFVDGNGLFHYREFGLACHLGVLSGMPCVGVAKNLLQVQGVNKSEEHQLQISALQKGGDSFPLTAASGKVLGKALRSSDKSSKPVYVSVGHKISVDTAVRLTHSCCHYRVPEPIRQADYRSREYLRIHFPGADT